MLPLVRDGDVVTVRSARMEELRVGDIVCYRSVGQLVLHRVIGRAGDKLLARGDALPAVEPVAAVDVLGRAVALERGGRRRRLDTRVARRVGRVAVTVAPWVARTLPAARAARRWWITATHA
jgi:hypothetical protein